MTRALPLFSLVLLLTGAAHAGPKPPPPMPESLLEEPTPEKPQGPLDIGPHGTLVHAEFGFETTEGDACRAFLNGRTLTTTNRTWSGFECAYPDGRQSVEITEAELHAFVALLTQHAAKATFTPNDTFAVSEPAQDLTTTREVRTSQGSLDFGGEKNAWEIEERLLELVKMHAPSKASK